jgi:aminoglycoside 6'-N-acetyltransferase
MPDSLPTLRSERLTLRPLADEDVEPVLAIIRDPSVHEWWGDTDEEEIRNEGLAFVIEVGGELAGWLGFYEETDEQYRHARVDISLDPSHQDRGIGPEAIRTVIDWLRAERGHHRFVIDPAAHNLRAIAAYEKVGFKPVGRMRDYERGPDGTWRDGLLMDLLARELDPPR